MKIVLQRVSYGRVKVEGRTIGEIDQGLVLLVGFGQGDSAPSLSKMATKIAQMRIFPNEQSKFHLSLLDIGGGALLVPQFTLFADTSKGRRPEFFGALEPVAATQLFNEFVSEFRKIGVKQVATGEFGAHMEVELLNDGPVTIILEN